MSRVPTILILPGASLLEITQDANGDVSVRCPGCGESWQFAPTGPGLHETTLRHDDACLVLATIREAQARQAAAAGARSN